MRIDERSVNIRTVRVEWEGPLSLDQVKALDDEDDDCGLYQIYGRHIIFGAGSLLYIGMTTVTYNRRFFSGPDPHIDWLAEDQEEEDLSVVVLDVLHEAGVPLRGGAISRRIDIPASQFVSVSYPLIHGVLESLACKGLVCQPMYDIAEYSWGLTEKATEKMKE